MPNTIRLTMKVSEYGSATPPGTDCQLYVAGETYEFPDDGPDGLAGVFLREAWAVREEEHVADADPLPSPPPVAPNTTEKGPSTDRISTVVLGDAPAKPVEALPAPLASEDEHPVREALLNLPDVLKAAAQNVGQKIHDAVAPDEATVRERLEEKAMPDLREIAKKAKVKVGFGMRKDALIDALIAAGVKG